MNLIKSRHVLLFSAIVIATPFVFASLFWAVLLAGDFSKELFREEGVDFTLFLMLCSFLAIIAGYIGLWRNLIFNSKGRLLTSILLLTGITGFFIFLFEGGTNRTIEWILAFREPFKIIAFLWPVIVALVILGSNISSRKTSYLSAKGQD